MEDSSAGLVCSEGIESSLFGSAGSAVEDDDCGELLSEVTSCCPGSEGDLVGEAGAGAEAESVAETGDDIRTEVGDVWNLSIVSIRWFITLSIVFFSSWAGYSEVPRDCDGFVVAGVLDVVLKYFSLRFWFCSFSCILTVSERTFIFLDKSLFSDSSSIIFVLAITSSCFRRRSSASCGVSGGVPAAFFFFCLALVDEVLGGDGKGGAAGSKEDWAAVAMVSAVRVTSGIGGEHTCFLRHVVL